VQEREAPNPAGCRLSAGACGAAVSDMFGLPRKFDPDLPDGLEIGLANL
jgi:hypothetical protein